LRAYLDWVDEGQRLNGESVEPLRGRHIAVEGLSIHDEAGRETHVLEPGQRIEIRVHVRVAEEVCSPWFSVGVTDGRPGDLILLSMLDGDATFDLAPGLHTVACRTGPLPLNPRVYELWLSVREQAGAADLVDWSPVGRLRVRAVERGGAGSVGSVTTSRVYGPVHVDQTWSLDSVARDA
jgi:Wzt C-terminal domain